MHAKLVVIGGKANKSQVSLKVPGMIGRSREADLTVAHPMVSRRHCEIVESGSFLKIRDLGSLNGTFVRKKQIREAELRPNDEFTVGPLTFRVEYEPRLAVAPPPNHSEDKAGSIEQASHDPSGTPLPIPPESSIEQSGSDSAAPAATADSEPIGVAPPNGLLPASWEVATDSSASSEKISGNTSSPSETGPLPSPTGDSSDEADFDLASEDEGAADDPRFSDPGPLAADSAEEKPAPTTEKAGADDENSRTDESTEDEDLDAFFKQLE